MCKPYMLLLMMGGGDFYPSDVEDFSPSKIAYLFMVVDK
jgi:hypothetical protein